ncbi:MAG: hypothetical protein Fur0032_19790 [Terrimicrobiaceae bacterium]
MSRNPDRPAREGAYTLFEILLVLALMAIISGAAIPMLMTSERPEDAVEESLRSFARRVRADALSTGQPRRVWLRVDGLHGADDRAAPLPKGWELRVMRFGETRFRKPRKNEAWEFTPDGLLEPLSLQAIGQNSSITLDFCPLTALDPPR